MVFVFLFHRAAILAVGIFILAIGHFTKRHGRYFLFEIPTYQDMPDFQTFSIKFFKYNFYCFLSCFSCFCLFLHAAWILSSKSIFILAIGHFTKRPSRYFLFEIPTYWDMPDFQTFSIYLSPFCVIVCFLLFFVLKMNTIVDDCLS